jgi:hypothetical protein
MAAPSKYNENIARKICDRIRKGQSFTSACISEGVEEMTGRRWKEAHPSFGRSVKEAQEKCKQALVDVLYNAATQGTKVETTKTRIGDVSFEEISTTIDTASKAKYAQWMLPRIDPENWSEQAKIEKMVQAEVREWMRYLMETLSDSAKSEVATKLLAAGFEVNADIATASTEAIG